MTRVRTAILLSATALVTGLPACGDDPFRITWNERRDTVLLYSLSRPERNLPSAFDFLPDRRTTREVEAPGATGNWDLAVHTRDGEVVFVPPGDLGIESRAGIATFPGLSLEELEEAPSDTTVFVTDAPVPAEVGTAYVIRTRERSGSFGRVCVYYAEMQPLEVDGEVGTVRFVYDVNPRCNDRSLVPDVTGP